MTHYITQICPICGNSYQADVSRLKFGRQTTCSRACSYKLRSQKQENKISVECDFCGRVFNRWPSQVAKTTLSFCSTECHDAWRIAKTQGIQSQNPHEVKKLKSRKCGICGKQFRANKDSAKYCCRKCFEVAHHDNMTGVNNPSYIDGRSYDVTYDAGADWYRLRRRVYKRDQYICQICGVKCIPKSAATKHTSRNIIQCHHIDPYKQSQNNSMDNLITLCLKCHRNVHNGKAKIK